MVECCLSPARSGEGIALSWSTDPDLAIFRETGPAELLVARARVVPFVPLARRYSILTWRSYPSLLTCRLVRPYQVKVLFEWTAASASYQARDTASAASHQFLG